jgi:VanZ family protein
MKKRILMWLPSVIMMVLIFVASATPGDEVPEFGSIDLLIKKGGHMTGYALLAAACFLAVYVDTKNVKRSAILSLCLAIVYAAADEYHQSFIPGRSPSVMDVGIDTAGAIVGLAIVVFITRLRFSNGART